MHTAAVRTTQHKQKREEAKAKELSDLKRENNQLKRKVSRLEKLICRYESLIDDRTIFEEETIVSEEPEQVETEPEQDRCPKCFGVDLAEIAMNSKTFVICRSRLCLNRWVKVVVDKT